MTMYYDPYEARHSGVVPEFFPPTDYADEYLYPSLSPSSLGQLMPAAQMITSPVTDTAVPEVVPVGGFQVASPIQVMQPIGTGDYTIGGAGNIVQESDDYGEFPPTELIPGGGSDDTIPVGTGLQRMGDQTISVGEGVEVTMTEPGAGMIEPKKEIPWTAIGLGAIALILLMK